MPKVDNVGYGEVTPLKLECLKKIFAMHLVVTRSVLRRHSFYKRRYRYMDLTAGKGWNPNGLYGSPLLFIEAIKSSDFDIPYRADFIECEKENLNELQHAMHSESQKNGWRLGDIHYHSGCYEDIICSLLKTKNAQELGLVFVDPSGELPTVETLKFVARQRPGMEILIYISSTNVKRLFPYENKLLSDLIQEIGKDHWLIRKPIPWDQHKWTFLLGSRFPFKTYKKIDFFRLESEEAQSFFPELNLTIEQRRTLVQPSLFKDQV